MALDLKVAKSKRLTGRLTEHFGVIRDARERGVEWDQITVAIGPLVGIDPNDKDSSVKMRQAYHRARQGIEKGRLRINAITQTVADKGQATGIVKERLAQRPLPGEKRAPEDMRAELKNSGIPVDD